MVSSNYISHIGIQNCRGWGTMYIASKITGLVFNYNFVFVWRKHFTTNFKYIDKLNFTFLCSFKQIMQSITLFNFNITDGGRGGMQVCLTCVVISSMLSDFTLYLTEYLL